MIPDGQKSQSSMGVERGQSFCHSVLLCRAAWHGMALLPCEELWAGESSKGGMNPALSLSSLVPVISSELSVLCSHNSPKPKPMALLEAPLALKPLLEITQQICSQEDTVLWRITCIRLWLHFP